MDKHKTKHPLCWGALTPEPQNAALEIGWREMLAGKGIPAEEVFAELGETAREIASPFT